MVCMCYFQNVESQYVCAEFMPSTFCHSHVLHSFHLIGENLSLFVVVIIRVDQNSPIVITVITMKTISTAIFISVVVDENKTSTTTHLITAIAEENVKKNKLVLIKIDSKSNYVAQT